MGRGGRDVVTAAELLSVPAFLAGRNARAFPSSVPSARARRSWTSAASTTARSAPARAYPGAGRADRPKPDAPRLLRKASARAHGARRHGVPAADRRARGARAPPIDVRRGRRRARPVDGEVRDAPRPLVRQLLRMRQLLRPLPGQRSGQGSMTSPLLLRDRPPTSAKARAGRSRWIPSRSDLRLSTDLHDEIRAGETAVSCSHSPG